MKGGESLGLFSIFKNNPKPPPAKPNSAKLIIQATGITHKCAFPSARFKGRSRQFVLDKCKVGDAVSLKLYTWKDDPAYAIMAVSFETDIGVVPADKVKTVSKFISQHKTSGVISDIHILNPDEEDYRKQTKIFSITITDLDN